MERDTLPRAYRDETLTYEGYSHPGAVCRMRIYLPSVSEAIVVLTELPENENTSITNRAERAYCLAWEAAGMPASCRFVEHYPGEAGEETDSAFGEHVSRVEFQRCREGLLLSPFFFRGFQRGWRFAHPRWTHVPLAEFFALVGAGERRAR